VSEQRPPEFYVGCIVPLYRNVRLSLSGDGGVTVRRYEPEGVLVLDAAPASLKLDVPKPDGGRGAWFVFAPDSAIHGKMHGVTPDFALYADIAWV
jgi:hypothetical protein